MARKHDETYKLIFSQRAAVEELIRNFVGKRLADELDFDTLEPLPTNRISGGLVQRVLDLLCKVRFRGGWLYLLILLEFQSENDPFMALREQDPGSRDLVTSLGILERDPTPENLQRILRGLARRFRGPEFAEFHQALRSWVAGAAKAWQISEADLAGMMSITEDEEIYERAKELRDQVHRDGVRQGLEQGRIRERALLVRRFATRKFGAETAERLTRILEDRADAERIDEVFDAIIDCDSGAELFARVRG